MECIYCKGRMEKTTTPFSIYRQGDRIYTGGDASMGWHSMWRTIL